MKHGISGTTHVWGDEIVRRCSICQEEFRGQGNNAEPVNEGRCCDPCNHTTVFTARINVMSGIMRHVDEGTINSDDADTKVVEFLKFKEEDV